LDELRLLDRVGVLSTISGGSVIGAYYAYTPDKPFDEFANDIRRFLRRGFHGQIAFGLAEPANFVRSLISFLSTATAELWAVVSGNEPRVRRRFSRTEIFREVLERELFAGLKLTSPTRQNIKVVIGSCELQTGVAFRFGNDRCGDWRHGVIAESECDVSLAVAASAAYPIFLPALDRTWEFEKGGERKRIRVLLTDGGLYDNLGLQVLEPGRDPAYSAHTFPCDYLIACNAGPGQDAGDTLPLGFYRRVKRSFEIVHRRVQEATMHRLHYFKQTGAVRGFALPYLGQMDESLPATPSNFVSRAEVVNYPTDFGAMSDEWINRLSLRGQQLTELLVRHYLGEII
jgi:NTE family protein